MDRIRAGIPFTTTATFTGDIKTGVPCESGQGIGVSSLKWNSFVGYLETLRGKLPVMLVNHHDRILG